MISSQNRFFSDLYQEFYPRTIPYFGRTTWSIWEDRKISKISEEATDNLAKSLLQVCILKHKRFMKWNNPHSPLMGWDNHHFDFVYHFTVVILLRKPIFLVSNWLLTCRSLMIGETAFLATINLLDNQYRSILLIFFIYFYVFYILLLLEWHFI